MIATGARTLKLLLYEHGVRRQPQSPGPVPARRSQIWTPTLPVLRVRMQQPPLAPSARRWAQAVRRTVPVACSRPKTVPGTRRFLRGTPDQATTFAESRRCRRWCELQRSCPATSAPTGPCCAQTYKGLLRTNLQMRGRFVSRNSKCSGKTGPAGGSWGGTRNERVAAHTRTQPCPGPVGHGSHCPC